MERYKQRYLHFIVMFALFVMIGLCPPIGEITHYGMKILAIFVAVLYGWIFIDLLWPSIFGFIALGVVGSTAGLTIAGALGSGIGNIQLINVLISLVFAGALEESGVNDMICTVLLKQKFFRKSPWLLIAGLCVIAYIMGIFVAGLAVVFLLWSVIKKIAVTCNIDKHDPLISFLYIAIAIIVFSGGLVMPFHVGALVYGGFLTQATGQTLPYVPFILFCITITALSSILLVLFGKFILRLDASKFILPNEVILELEQKKITKGQKVASGVLVLFICMLLLPELIPSVPGMKFIGSLGLVGVGLICFLIMNFITIDQKPLINLSVTFKNSVQWPVLLLLAVTFPLADAIKSTDSGIMITVNQMLTPIVSNMGPIQFMIVSMILLGLLTQVTHNIVLGAMFIPFLCPLCEQIGGNSMTLWFMIFLILNMAYITPAGSMQSAIIHGDENINSKYAYMMGTVNLLICFIVLAVVGIPLGELLF